MLISLQETQLLPSPNQLRNKIIIKHKAPNQPAQALPKSDSMSLSTSLTAAIDEETIEDDETLLPLVQNVSVN